MIERDYYKWLIDNIRDEKHFGKYKYLLEHLYDTDFIVHKKIPMDINRLEDGLNLRYRFAYFKGISPDIVEDILSNKECSVLEMMIGLAIRCEEQIMGDGDVNDTGHWFWLMVENLGLLSEYDGEYNEHYVGDCLDIFLNREYSHDGRGALFTLPYFDGDFRDLEIWYQMMEYLNTLD